MPVGLNMPFHLRANPFHCRAKIAALSFRGDENPHGANLTAEKPELTKLVAEHSALKERLRILNRHLALTAAEQLEVAQLKKKKLLAKDRIRLLQQQQQQQPRIQP